MSQESINSEDLLKSIREIAKFAAKLYSVINEEFSKEVGMETEVQEYKMLVFKEVFNKYLDLIVKAGTVQPHEVKEAEVKRLEEVIPFTEYISKFDLSKIKYHYEKVAILVSYLESIGQKKVPDLLKAIEEYFPQVDWKIPVNLRRDTRQAIKKSYIACIDGKNLKDCYLIQKGREFLAKISVKSHEK